MRNRKKFRAWGRWLRKHFPIRCRSLRILLRMPAGSEPDDEGECRWDRDADGFPTNVLIYVRGNLAPSHTATVLIHEYAHAYRAQIPHLGSVDDERALHAVIERLIGNHWDKLRGVRGEESGDEKCRKKSLASRRSFGLKRRA